MQRLVCTHRGHFVGYDYITVLICLPHFIKHQPQLLAPVVFCDFLAVWRCPSVCISERGSERGSTHLGTMLVRSRLIFQRDVRGFIAHHFEFENYTWNGVAGEHLG